MNSKTIYLFFIPLGAIYLLFPTNNANIDSWYYGACVKHGQELINSHHLLYNITGRSWYLFLKIFNSDIEALAALNSMNALAATLSLFVVYQLLLLLGKESKPALWLSLFCGVSFGFMRYATDAETYILPLLFSLVSTYFFLRETLKCHLLWSSLFSVLAILMHQLHLWWALAMVLTLIFRKPFNFRSFLLFTLPFMLVPVVYYIAYLNLDFRFMSFWQFVRGEYARGNASIDISLKGMSLTAINFLRSFIQVHGQIADIFLHNVYLYSLIGLILVSLKIYFLKTGKFKFSLSRLPDGSKYSGLFLLAFIFHLLFAFLSSGNAEFMVMLPFLAALYLASRYEMPSHVPVMSASVIIFIWNMSTAIMPARILDLNRVDQQVELTIKNPNVHFLWKHKPLVENIITYRKGFCIRCPNPYIPLNAYTVGYVNSILPWPVYTDFPNPGTRFSREEIVGKKNFSLDQFKLSPVRSWENIYGKNHIYLISKKGD